MRKADSVSFQTRWIVASLALLVALMVALSWSTMAYAQTPADSAYGSPLSSPGSGIQGPEENTGINATSGGAVGGAAVDGSGVSSEDDVNVGPDLEALPDTGGASLLLGSAVTLMLVGTGMLAIRQIRR